MIRSSFFTMVLVVGCAADVEGDRDFDPSTGLTLDGGGKFDDSTSMIETADERFGTLFRLNGEPAFALAEIMEASGIQFTIQQANTEYFYCLNDGEQAACQFFVRSYLPGEVSSTTESFSVERRFVVVDGVLTRSSPAYELFGILADANGVDPEVETTVSANGFNCSRDDEGVTCTWSLPEVSNSEG